MTKFNQMLKLEFLGLFGINKLLHENNNKGKLIGYSILFVYIIVVLLGTSTLYSFLLAKSLNAIGAAHLLLSIMMAVSCLIVLITTVFRASSTLFSYKDYDILMSLPINTATIIMSRLAVLYCLNIIFTLFLLVPAFVMYSIVTGFSLMVCISFFLSLLFVPLVPIIVATVVGMLIALISSRFRFTNIINMIFSFIFLIGTFVASFAISFSSSNVTGEQLNDLAKMLSEQIFKIYPLTQLYTNGVCLGNIVSLFLFIAISVVVFVIFVYLITSKYKSICSILLNKRTSRNYKITTLKGDSSFYALYKKELKRYFSSTVYVFNTGFGAIMLVIAAIACLFIDIKSIPALKPIINNFMQILPMIISAFIGTVCTTSCAISLEGKSFWILKSAPIKASFIYYSKILVNLTITVPALLISNTLLIIGFKIDPLNALLLFISPLVFTVCTSIFGLFINLKFPTFDWENDAVVVKQSVSAMMGMFIPLLVGVTFAFISAAVPGALTIVVINFVLLLATFMLNKLVLRIPLNKIN